MTQNAAVTLALVLTAALLAVRVFVVNAGRGPSPSSAGGPPEPSSGPVRTELLVREDSRYLSRADEPAGPTASAEPTGSDDGRTGTADVTVVEFLDFECEACRAQFPVMERIRAEYEGRIDFVIRYFPLPGHGNSRPAALAVEAAAEQGALEDMYVRMYETQGEWGESEEPKDEVFVGFAKDLGLDVGEFRETVADPATMERVRADFDDGVALGVQGTPTIYVNGRQTGSMPAYETLASMIDAELEP